jgi:hypothetical protein
MPAMALFARRRARGRIRSRRPGSACRRVAAAGGAAGPALAAGPYLPAGLPGRGRGLRVHRGRAVDQGHRAAEPTAEGLRAEPGLVRDRRAGLRAAGLDADARPWQAPPAGGNPSGCGCACSQPQAAWPVAAAVSGSALPGTGRGPPTSPPRPPGCRPSRPADQPESSLRP